MVESLAWHEIDTGTQDALIELVVRAHGYTRSRAENHFAGSGTDDETTVMLIRHMFNMQTSPPPPPPLSSSSSYGRAARGGSGGDYDDVTMVLQDPDDNATRPHVTRKRCSVISKVLLEMTA